MYAEEDLVPISALQHLLFCERQTALIHLERLWEENRFTAEGQVLHQKTDAARSETRDGIRITRSLPIHSFKLGLAGYCDVVHFQPPDNTSPLSLPQQIRQQLQQTRGRRATLPDGEESHEEHLAFHDWTITPVEYKRGKPKSNDCDRVQLCAQAMCLEEMLNVLIPQGDLFYGKKQRRFPVEFDATLRQTTQTTASRLHQLFQSGITPSAVREPKCDTCSLLELCLPPVAGQSAATDYLQGIVSSD